MLGIFLDIETSGLNSVKHRALEIAFKILDIETFVEKAVYESIIIQSKEVWEQSDPVSLTINGFTWDLVQQGKTETVVATDIEALFLEIGILRKQAVYICQNPSFDRVFFSQLIDADIQENRLWPYHWLDLASMYWTRQLQANAFPWVTGISKDNIAKHYDIPNEEQPHRAMHGVNHLIACYKAVNA